MLSAEEVAERMDIYDEDKGWKLRIIADKIQDRHKFKCVEHEEEKTLYVYQNGVWKPKGETVVESECLDITEELLRSNNIKQVQRIIKHRNKIERKHFRMKDYLIPFRNGVYDIQRDEFRDHMPEDQLTFKHQLTYITEDMIQEAQEDEDIESLKAIYGMDAEDFEQNKGKVDEFIDTLVDTERKKQILRETVGMSLATNYPIQEAPILYGKGSNGKNMFVKMLKRMSESWHSLDLNEATDDQFAKKEMEGSSFVFFDELGHIKNPEKLKSFIGDEDMRVRPMRDTGYMGKQRAQPILAGNDIPKAPEQNEGFFRRFCIVDFPYKFTSQDDEHKDKKPKREIIDEYLNRHALSIFASKVARDMKQVVDNEGFTESRDTKSKKQMWNMKSSAVYTFLDLFVEQGKLPEQGSKTQCDTVRKDRLLDMVNDFVDSIQGTKVRSHELTKAIESEPNLETGIDQRVDTADGSTHRAYSGLVMVIPDYRDYQTWSDLIETRDFSLLQYSDMFEDSRPYQSLQELGIAETSIEAKALRYLRNRPDGTTSLLTVIKGLDLCESDLDAIMGSEFIEASSKEGSGLRYPDLSIDQEAFDTAVKESGLATKDERKIKSLNTWLKDHIDSWSKETVKKVDEVIDSAESEGFDRDKVEDLINQLEKDGIIYEPKPGNIKKI